MGPVIRVGPVSSGRPVRKSGGRRPSGSRRRQPTTSRRRTGERSVRSVAASRPKGAVPVRSCAMAKKRSKKATTEPSAIRAQPRRSRRRGRRCRDDVDRCDADRPAVQGGGRGGDGRPGGATWPVCRSGCSRRAPPGDPRRVLLMLQGMDTSGKDGVINHVVGLVDPGGVRLASFKKPTEEELAHDFLWRIEKRVPPGGLHRGVQPVAVRGRAGRPGAQAGARGGVARAVRGDQRLRDAGSSTRRDDRQVLPAHLAGRADASGSWLGWTTRRSTGSTTRATSTSAATGTPIRQAYSDALRECSTESRPGTSSRRIASGTGTGRSRALLTEALETINPAVPAGHFDIETEKRRVLAS